MINEKLTYKNYSSIIHYNIESEIFYGKIENIEKDIIWKTEYQMDCYNQFTKVVDEYIASNKL